MLAASFRQGMTTDTSTCRGIARSKRRAAGVCWTVLMPVAVEAPAVINARRRAKSRAFANPRARTRMVADGCVTLPRSRARLPGLRLPLPVHGRRSRALVSQPRRAPRGRRPRGHVFDPAPVAARHRPGRPRGPGGDGRPAHAPVRGRPPPDRAARGLRRRRALAPAAPRAPLRRRAHRLVPVLLAAGGRGRAAAWALPAAGGLARDLDDRLLARVSGARPG